MKTQVHNKLKELATTILDAEDLSIQDLKEKAQQLYEQATLLAYAEKNEIIENTILEGEELNNKVHEKEEKVDFDLPDFEPMEVLKEPEPVSISSTETIVSKPKVSLNDTLNKGFQVGLNDRLAFVSQLFGGNQEDYTRVISQLNTTETLSEAQQFINEIVKPEYNNWEGKEAFELRFLDLVERNFQE